MNGTSRRKLVGKRRIGLALTVLSLLLLTACSSQASNTIRIDGNTAIEHASAIVANGPHPPGSVAQMKAGLYIIEQLKKIGLKVQTQAFTASTPLGPKDMVNIWGELPGTDPSILLIASHYDSKYFEEFEFVGANDGGSSSGLLLEMARVLHEERPLDFTIWFVFFDGEESFRTWTETDSLYGSRELAAMLVQRDMVRQVRAMVLLDLVGGQDLRLVRDVVSTPWLTELIWQKAAEMGYDNIFRRAGSQAAQDDHLPFLDLGIPAVDIIDLQYRHWHTPEDTIDKLSAENLEIVGEVVLRSLVEIQERLKK